MLEQELEQSLDENFRNSIGTMTKTGVRKWVYPKKPKGKFTNYRTILSWIFLTIFFLTPFIKLPNGNPLFKFDVLNTEFILFGFPFFTSDFFLLAIGMLTTVFFIVIFTNIYGRIFCGWLCPQTIFLEMVFRKIEYAIEGDRAKQIRLDKQEWNQEKIIKKGSKWTIYLLISIIVAHVFIAYIIGSEELINIIKQGPIENSGILITMLTVGGGFLFVFSWFREQACTLVCPYGRFQGVLIDKKSIMVSYDYKRGESKNGRSKFKKTEDRNALGIGDCIDCHQCVAVCPTGIDIRNGSQLECVGCTACIDACDEIMVKIDKPKGLIRYASEEQIVSSEKFRLTPKIVAFSLLLIVFVGITTSFILNRSNVEGRFFQMTGKDYQIENNYIMNYYRFNLINKTNQNQKVRIKISSHKNAKTELINESQLIDLQKAELKQGSMKVMIPKNEVHSYKEKIEFELVDQNNQKIDRFTSSFSAPFVQ